MEVKICVAHVDREGRGDSPKDLVLNDVNKTETVNMYLNGEHYRVDLTIVERVVKAMI